MVPVQVADLPPHCDVPVLIPGLALADYLRKGIKRVIEIEELEYARL